MTTKKLVKAAPKEKETFSKRIMSKDIGDMTPDEYESFKLWLASEEKAELIPQPIFFLRGVPYVPHYNKKHNWVGPGNEQHRKIYTTTELTEVGARLKTMMLWKRSWTEEVEGWKTH